MLAVPPPPAAGLGLALPHQGTVVLTTAWLLDLVAGCQLSRIPLPKSNLKEGAEFQKKS